MKKLSKAVSVLCAGAMLFSATCAYADAQTDALARIQISNENRLDITSGLNGSGLTAFDVVSHHYVYEDFNTWSTDRATHVGATYSGYSSFAERAKEKLGGLMPTVSDTYVLPFNARGSYGTLSTNKVIPGINRGSGSTLGWFGSEEDGYLGIQNNGAKVFYYGVPTPFNYSNDADSKQAAYGAESDRLLYVGDTNKNGKIDAGDWLNFEGTLVVSYDWLVSETNNVYGELNLLQNYAVIHGPWDGNTGKSIQDFNITGLPGVWKYNGKVVVKHNAGKVVRNNKSYNHSDAGILPWQTTNSSKYTTVEELEGVNVGDWVNITTVINVSGTTENDRVFTLREYVNGEILTDANGNAECKIYPYETDYRFQGSQNRPVNGMIETYPVGTKDGANQNLDFYGYYGIGISLTTGGAGDGTWSGIDNVCYRVYNDTELEKVRYGTSDIENGILNIATVTDTGLSDAQAFVAPKAATAGIVNTGSGAQLTVRKINIEDDPLAISGDAYDDAAIARSTTIDLDRYAHEGTVTGKKYFDGSGIRVSGLSKDIASNEGYAISIKTTDALGYDFARNLMVTDSSADGFVNSVFYDNFNGDITSSVTRTASKEYKISSDTQKIVFNSSDITDSTVALTDADNTVFANFDGGVYTLEFDKPLVANKEYTLKKGGNTLAKIVPFSGTVKNEPTKTDDGKPAVNFSNATEDKATGYIIATNGGYDLEAKNFEMQPGEFGTISMDTTNSYEDVIVFDDFKQEDGEAELDSEKQVVDPFVGTKSSVSGNFGEAGKDVTLVILQGADFKDDADVASSIIYLATTKTKQASASTLEGPSEYETGDYVFDIDFPSSMTTDKYTFMIYCGNDAYRRVVPYAVSAENKDAIASLVSSPETALADETTRNKLEFYYGAVETLYDSAELDAFYADVAQIIKNDLAVNSLSSDSDKAKAEAVQLYRHAAIMTALKDGKLTSLDKVAGDIKFLNEDPMQSWWKQSGNVESDFETTWRKDVASKLSGKTYANVSEFEREITKAVILEIVEHAGSKEVVKNILSTSFGTYNTINASSVTDYASGSVMRIAYSDLSQIQAALDKANNSANLDDDDDDSGYSKGHGTTGSSVGSVTVGGNTAQTPAGTPSNTGLAYADMKDAEWANDAVKALKAKGIVNGKSADSYDPNGLVTREEFVKMMMLLAKINVEHGEINFDDVTSDAWFYTYVKAAFQKGIVNGMSDTSFGVGQNITRQDLATIVNNTLVYLGTKMSNGEITFDDKDSVSDYAQNAVSKLVATGILNGYEDNTFRPNGYATRAEAAKILYEVSKLLG